MATYNVTVDQAYYDNLSAGAKEGLIRTAISSAGPKIQADLIKNAQKAHKSINITSTRVKVTLNANATFRDYNWKFSYGITVNGSAPGYLSASASGVGLNPPVRAVYTYKSEVGGDIVGGDGSFKPPTPSNVEKIEDIPFYEDLLKSGEIGSFDDLTQPEFDYLQDEVQKGEVGLLDTLVNMAKDFFMGSSDSNVFKDVNISYDGDNPDIVAYYADNGLDTSKSYNINMDGIRVGYDTGDGFVPILENSGISKNGSYSVSKESKNNFLSNGGIFALHTVNGTLGNLGNPVPGAIAVSAAVVANDYLNKILDPVQQNQLDLLKSGYSYVVNKAQNLFNGFTSTGDRSKDLFNHAVQSEAYTKGITNVVQGGVSMSDVGIDLKGQSIPISLPTTGIALTVPTTGVALNVPTTGVNLNIPTATNIPLGIPTTGVDLNVPSTGVALNVPVTGVQLDVTGKEIGIVDGAKVQLDIPKDTALPVEGLDDNFKAVYANKANNISKTDIILSNSLEAHRAEYITEGGVRGKEKIVAVNSAEAYKVEYVSEGGIRAKEGAVADWKDLEYKTPVLENGVQVNKIKRDIKAWQGMHSLNPAGTITDTIGNNIPISKGIIPAIQGVGMLDGIRESLIDKANDNVLARAKAKSKIDEDDDENSMIDNLFSILGVKLDSPVPSVEDLKKSPHLGAILSALGNINIQNNEN